LKKPFFLSFTLLVLFSFEIASQNGFRFLNDKKSKQRISFKLINNLIVMPLEINGQKLSFILDSGVSKTILFNISQNDSIGLNDVERVELRGLGDGESVKALLSKNNKISINNIVSTNETIYVVLKDNFDLSAKMGITIHGIIGYNLLRNFIVKINYNTTKINFYNSNKFKYKSCRKCEVFPIQFYRKKPFIDAQVQLDTVGNALTDVKLLVDSGGSDAIWLFEGTKKNIKTPKRYFKDILGEGLSGAILGNRSRIPKIKLKSFEIIKPTASFLDTVSTRNARSYRRRNGSIGADVLRRFIVWFDYENRKLILKKNGSFAKGFNYNMSGLDIVYSGKQLVREKDNKNSTDAYNQGLSSKNSISFITSFSYRFKPSFKIKGVLKNSPAERAGLLKEDIILKINNTPSYEYSLNKIINLLQEKKGKRIRMVVERNGQRMKFEFYLEQKV
tara:strand:- start:22063 stop:23403 length:1341 start_codon:yes stop_codon:yes gene_type:complete